MAAPSAMSRFHITGRAAALRSYRKLQVFLRRGFGSDAAAVHPQTVKLQCEEQNGRRALHVLQEERRRQAERSVLISCHGQTDQKSFLQYLSQHGDIKAFFFYESFGLYAVVEFAHSQSVASLLESAAIPSASHEAAVPFKSRLLFLRNLDSVDSTGRPPSLACQPQTTIPVNELVQRLSRQESIDQQMMSLTEAYQLTEENSRLRFLVCSLLKDIAAAYFPECTIKPFGSSVNGFGKLGCDLDMFLDLDSISGRNMKTPKSGLSLEYQMKRSSSERAVTQSVLSVIGECVDQFGPGCVGVQKILHARCPLVRFSHQPSGFQCDLTANNRVAMKSTELLYLYGELDARVRSLVFTVRCWARVHGITSSIPGAWITNFSLTMMVLFFLQKRSPPIIPTLDQLQGLAGPADRSVIDGNNCTFVSDFGKIQLQRNTDTLEQLLSEFFDFYATFPFSRSSINIRKGREQNKPEVSPLHIQNPFETSLNVSKNVNATQLDRFVALCQESSWLLQQSHVLTPRSSSSSSSSSSSRTVAQAWGLATLLLPSQVAAVKSRKKKKPQPASERIKSLLESLKKKDFPKS